MTSQLLPISIGAYQPRLSAIQKPVRLWIISLTLWCALVYTIFTFFPSARGLPSRFGPATPVGKYSREAYVLYYPTSGAPAYMENGNLLTIFGLKHDLELRDPQDRDIIVIVTNLTCDQDIRRLEQAGVKTFRIPYSLRPLMPSRDFWAENYRHVWDKLWLWALTDYERVLYMDSDIVFNKPIYPVWDDPHAWPKHGLAATADWQGLKAVPMPDGPYFNSGFMMVRPNMTMFEELVKVDMGDHTLQWPDQDLLNEYFKQAGDHPWEPLDHMFVSLLAGKEDIEGGVHVLHDKAWRGGSDAALKDLWWERMGRMRGWNMAMAEWEQGKDK